MIYMSSNDIKIKPDGILRILIDIKNDNESVKQENSIDEFAKNKARRTIVLSSSQYEDYLKALKEKGL